jgi:mycofactocin radical SAM maturase
MKLVEHFELGLDAPICLTWELTYACNLECAHCLSSSGRRDPRELTTAQAEAVIDELQRMQVFYVNIGGGEPTIRPDFWHLLEYAVNHQVGVKFSTNGTFLDATAARRLAAMDYLDVQISLDGADAAVNDVVRGEGSYAAAIAAMDHLAEADFGPFKISLVVTRHNVDQLDEFKAIADRYQAQLRLTRLRPSGRGADVWDELKLFPAQQKQLYDWLVANGENVLTGDSFFHLAAFGDALPGLNLCGAGRVVCLIDPVGDVYACPFAIHDSFKAGSVREERGFQGVWRDSELFAELREPQNGGACKSCHFFDSCRGGCMAAKFFTGLPLDGPDPECVRGFGETALAEVNGPTPKPSLDHSHKNPLRGQASKPGARKLVPITLGTRPLDGVVTAPPLRGCDENPLTGFSPDGGQSVPSQGGGCSSGACGCS